MENRLDSWVLLNGYTRYCSYSCCNSATEIVLKKKLTTKQRYGNETYRNVELSRKTRLEKYGQFNSKECIEKVKATKHGKTVEQWKKEAEQSRLTRQEKYGQWIPDSSVEHAAQTRLEKYGDANYNNREKAAKTFFEKYGVTHISKFFLRDHVLANNTAILVNDAGENVSIKCKQCNKVRILKRDQLLSRKKEILCDLCNPYPEKTKITSIEEQLLLKYVQSIYTGTIRRNDRTILSKHREIDIYLPEKRLAIEFDGLFWHSDKYKPITYHIDKTIECENKNIQLIHIFEDEWHDKQEIVKSRISGLLGKNNRIFARKCIVKTVSNIETNKFLENNHIQGACSSKFKYGLYYDGELVSVMTFGKSRFKKNEYEMIRFCNKLYTNIIGGASKLFKHFLKDHPEITNIVSYADRRWSIGNLYEKIGFTKVKTTEINYFYVNQFKRESRMKYQKHKLVAMGADPTKTEHEIMQSLKYYRIYDCGNIKFEYKKSI